MPLNDGLSSGGDVDTHVFGVRGDTPLGGDTADTPTLDVEVDTRVNGVSALLSRPLQSAVS